MKTKLVTVYLMILLVMAFIVTPMNAQDEKKESPFSIGADFVSSYVWRGSKIGNGPNIQPAVSFSSGNFTIGSWGSYSFMDFGDVSETDLYASYGFDFGLTLGLTDYYYQGSKFFDFDNETGSHALEINLGYAINSFSVTGNYVINDASMGGPANKPGGGDIYFELGYAFENFDVFMGSGNGWHTTYEANGDDIFTICNLGIKTSKELKISDAFSLPVSGAVSVNPDKEEFNLVVGFSF